MARFSVSSKKDDSKQSRKELLKRDDAFISAAEGTAHWANTNRKPLTLGAVAVLVAAIVGVVINGVMESGHEKDAEALAVATKIMSAETAAPDEPANPTASDKPTYANEHDRDLAARDAFKKVADKASGKQAQLARFMVADLSAKIGEKEQAEKELDKLLTDMAPSDSLYFLAVERDAYLKEARGDLAGAMSTFERLKGDAFYADRAGVQEARLALAQGDKAKARTILNKVKADYPKSPASTQATDMLTQMGELPKVDAAPTADSDSAPRAKAD
jgi:hypothetical protein